MTTNTIIYQQQIVHETAVQIAKDFTIDQEKWIEAAQKLWQLYWDWASKAVPPEQIIAQEYIEIINYDGKKCSV